MVYIDAPSTLVRGRTRGRRGDLNVAIARQRIRLPPGCWRSAIAGMLRGDLWDGEHVAQLETAFAEFIGTPDSVAVPSGRAGLRFIFDTLDLPKGSEILFSAFGYPVVPHLARTLGYDVRFVDSASFAGSMPMVSSSQSTNLTS